MIEINGLGSFFLLERAAGVFERHSRDFGEYSIEIIVIDDFQVEPDARVHDAGRAHSGQLQTIAHLLFRLDRALGAPSPDPVSIDDEAGAEQIGQFGKYHLIALFREHQRAKIGL